MNYSKLHKNDIVTLILRLLIAVAVIWILRIVFYFYNIEQLAIKNWSKELSNLITGCIIFDASNLTFTFTPFVIFSLLPFKFRETKAYQKGLFIYFIIAVTAIIILNLTDTVYFRYVFKRITIDEFSYFHNDNTAEILFKGVLENWYILLIAIALIVGSIQSYRSIKYIPQAISGWKFYTLNLVVLILATGILLACGRGGATRAIRPITLSNAAQYAETPQKIYLILSNPFCILKSIGNNKVQYTKYFSEDEVNRLYSPVHQPDRTKQIKKKNIVIFVLESFSYEHSKFLNPDLYKNGESYTPFLDSLMQQGYIFDRGYANGRKSIDALPSVIASIPSFKTPFALTDQALSPMSGLGKVLGNEGWDSWFFNGSERRSMGFVAFAKSAGYKNFATREDYEKVNGTNDFDGNWGIWDMPFLNFMANKLSDAKQPFLATTFTITSHHPFAIPEEYKNILPKGKTLVQPCIAYTDRAMQKFFQTAKTKNWYNNTIFVIVADHVSSEVYSPENRSGIGNSHIMYFMFTPDGSVKGRSSKVTQQIDIMPTVLGLINYNKPYFAFGRDFFQDENKNNDFAVNYNVNKFQWVTDSTTYIFDEKSSGDTIADKKIKAFIQSYYMHMEKRNFTLGK